MCLNVGGKAMELEDFFNVEESRVLNGLYLILILKNLERGTIEQLATSLYLYRFPYIAEKLMSHKDQIEFLKLFSYAELNNLDTMLYPFLIEKYNDRFINSFKELLARELVEVKGDYIILKRGLEYEELWSMEDIVQIDRQLFYIAKLIKITNNNELKKKIEEIVGEQHWRTHSL